MIDSPTFTVLGGSGFIGRRLVNELRACGVDFWVPKRQDPEVFHQPLGVVFYCIGLTSDYATFPFETVDAHVTYLSHLLQRGKFEHIVYLSSTRLYDNISTERVNSETSLSLDPCNPRHLYNLSKALGENLCLTLAKNRSSVARLSCVYDAEPGSPGFLSELLQVLRHTRSVVLNTSPNYCRDYITLADAVASLIVIGRQRACGVYNVASGVNTLNSDIADSLRPLGIDVRFNCDSEVSRLAHCDIDKLRDLGVAPANTLETVKKLVRSFWA